MSELDDLYAALQVIYARLDTLASINAANILVPSGPQARYHEVVEEAGTALGKVETIVDELREALEYEHRRLDEARDAALKEATKEYHQDENTGVCFARLIVF
jgi:hypothetical protein